MVPESEIKVIQQEALIETVNSIDVYLGYNTMTLRQNSAAQKLFAHNIGDEDHDMEKSN